MLRPVFWGVSAAIVVLVLSLPVSAQELPATDCAPTETQAECHARLKCLPDEDLEDCKKRLRGQGAQDGDGNGDGKQGDGNQGAGDDDDRQRGNAGGGDRDRQQQRRDRGDDDDDDDDDDSGHRGGGGGGDSIVRPGTHPGFFSGGIGPSFIVCYRSNCDLGGDFTQFYGSLDFGWHLMGDGFEGPALGANIHGGFGRVTGFDTGRFGGAFKFWWDIKVIDDVGFYVTPYAQAGMTSFFVDTNRYCYFDPTLGRICPRGSSAEHFFNLQMGMMLRLILGDRGLVYFQPATFDTVFNGDGVGLLYHFEVGGGVTFGD